LVIFRRPKADTYNGFMMLERGVGAAERSLFVIMITLTMGGPGTWEALPPPPLVAGWDPGQQLPGSRSVSPVDRASEQTGEGSGTGAQAKREQLGREIGSQNVE
jgi:hypothetical protein